MSMRSSLLAILLAMALPLVAGDPVREWRYELAQAGYEGRDELLVLLRSEEDKDLRFKAAYLLAREGRSEDAGVIEEVLVEPVWSEVARVGLARDASRLDRDRGAKIALRLLDELKTSGARADALTLLAEMGLAPRYEEILTNLEGKVYDDRKEAIRALGYLAESEAAETLEPSPTDVLLGVIEDPNEWIRWRAAFGLSLALRRAEGEPRQTIIEALCERRRNDASETVRKAATAGLGAVSAECGPAGVTWEALARESDAVCDVWIAGTREVGETLGTGRIFLTVPVVSTIATRRSLKGDCPKRFDLAWSFPEEDNGLGKYGAQVILFLRSDGEDHWELIGGRQGSWLVERRRVHPLSDEELSYISPASLENVRGVPEHLLTKQKFQVKVEGKPSETIETDAILMNDLIRWFSQMGSSEDSDHRQEFEG